MCFLLLVPESADCILEKAPRPQLSLGLDYPAPQALHTPLSLGSVLLPGDLCRAVLRTQQVGRGLCTLTGRSRNQKQLLAETSPGREGEESATRNALGEVIQAPLCYPLQCRCLSQSKVTWQERHHDQEGGILRASLTSYTSFSSPEGLKGIEH